MALDGGQADFISLCMHPLSLRKIYKPVSGGWALMGRVVNMGPVVRAAGGADAAVWGLS